MADLTRYYSHPNKQLTEHTDNVVKKVKSLTNLKIAEIAAIFHDAGKLNPNFQLKINKNFNKKTKIGYSNHAYLSALSFICYCKENQDQFLNHSNNKIELNKIASILAIIARHHGDLPYFPNILNEDEYSELLLFLDKNPYLPISEFIGNYIKHNYFSVTDQKPEELKYFRENFLYKITNSQSIANPLDFFIETQFAFASVIAADKSDASGYETQEYIAIAEFCNKYNSNLGTYIKQFETNSKINKIRNDMRKEANEKIKEELNKNNPRVFSLTAPTGSGKTIMLLSLAGEILNFQKNLRIIYALPFLSITEQVEEVCRKIFKEQKNYIRRIDSKSENKDFEKIQYELDSDPETIERILETQFAEDTFDYPFIITTFVRFFETLVSNKNATLLKIPNFANTIFLIDEIQSLPPRLYGFFVALLDYFCKKFNSYAIISTATMPEFELPENNIHNLHEFFGNYTKPIELLSLKYFKEEVFNRYYIERLPYPVTIDDIANMIKKEQSSVLVILNTIQDTKDLFAQLKEIYSEIILLNTHFTLNDRKTKIKRCKDLLNDGKRVILISTQLIEAGVDIDFPIVYRDFCPIPNIVQSAGRCNRNNKKNNGKMIVFDLQKDNKSRSDLIYQGKDSRFLNFAKEKIKNQKLHECELIDLQKSFFKDVQANTIFGTHYINQSKNEEINFIQCIKELAFEKIGKFRLIDEQKFGEEYNYYVCKTKGDELLFEKLKKLYSELKQINFNDFQNRKIKNIEIKNQLKNMADNVVQVRLKPFDSPPIAEEKCFGLLKLPFEYYNEDTGIRLTSENQIL